MAQRTASNGVDVRTWRRLGWAVAVATAPLWTGPLTAHGQVATTGPTPPAPRVANPAAAAPPALADVQAQIDQKQYAAAVRTASKLLATGGRGGAFSRFQVLMLKGDAQLGSHAGAAARTTYLDAARETHDPHERSLANWTLELLRRSKGTVYVPKVTAANVRAAGGGIDLLDADGRRTAFAALLDDELSSLGPKIKKASASPSLPEIFQVVQQVQPLADLDEIASGSDVRTAATASVLMDHARTLMATALKGMWTRISDIHSAATQQVTSNGGTLLVNGELIQQTVTGVNGLTPRDTSELRNMIDLCGKIHDAATTFAPLARAGDDKDWGTVVNDALRVAGRAGDVLNANYSNTTLGNPYSDGYNGPGTTVITTGVGTLGGTGIYVPPGTGGNTNGTFPNNGGTPDPNKSPVGPPPSTPVVTPPKTPPAPPAPPRRVAPDAPRKPSAAP